MAPDSVPTKDRRLQPQAGSILVIDDDRELCALMTEFLSQHGYDVRTAHTGQDGLREALSDAPDVITLDVSMPALDGFEVLRQIRRRSQVPVIMLTARTATDDRVDGLEAGADDYLPKPFQPKELLARIRAVCRRAAPSSEAGPASVEASGVRVSRERRMAWCRDRPLALTSAEFDILDLLVRSAGRVVSRDEITGVLYQRKATPYERAVDVHVSHLRKKLRAEGRDPIRTVRAVGYQFARD